MIDGRDALPIYTAPLKDEKSNDESTYITVLINLIGWLDWPFKIFFSKIYLRRGYDV
ncbi:MAG: hypothetical protein ACOC1V_07645 [Candidatus Saliniplasma sp.]